MIVPALQKCWSTHTPLQTHATRNLFQCSTIQLDNNGLLAGGDLNLLFLIRHIMFLSLGSVCYSMTQ
jgi:hypothetical protein